MIKPSLYAILFRRQSSSVCLFALFALLLGLSFNLAAVEITAKVYTDVEYSNNKRDDKTTKVDDVGQSVGFSAGLSEERKHVQMDMSFSVEKEHYYNGTFADETSFTGGLGFLNFGLIEDFLTWNTSFSRRLVVKDSFVADSPDNRSFRNILRSGPSIQYSFSEITRMSLSGEYVNVENTDDTSSDSEKFDANFGLSHAYNSLTDFSFTSSYGTVIDPDEGNDFDKVNVSVGLFRKLARGSLSFQVGRTRTFSKDVDVGEESSSDSNFFNIGFFREDLFWHTVSFGYKQEVSDAGEVYDLDKAQDFYRDRTEGGDGPSTVDEVSELVGEALEFSEEDDFATSKRFYIRVASNQDTHKYHVNFSHQTEEFDVRNFEERTLGAVLRYEQQLLQGLSVGASYAFKQQEVLSQPELGNKRSHTYTIDSGYDISQKFSVDGFLSYINQTNSVFSNRDYEEFVMGFSVSYELL